MIVLVGMAVRQLLINFLLCRVTCILKLLLLLLSSFVTVSSVKMKYQ